jgi:hypothetical protein
MEMQLRVGTGFKARVFFADSTSLLEFVHMLFTCRATAPYETCPLSIFLFAEILLSYFN